MNALKVYVLFIAFFLNYSVLAQTVYTTKTDKKYNTCKKAAREPSDRGNGGGDFDFEG